MFVRKAAHRDALCDSSATVKLLCAAGHFSCRARLRRVPPGSLRPSHSSCVRTVCQKNRAESIETLSFGLLFRGQSGVVRGEGDRISYRKLRASACYLAVRRHQETEEGRQRVVNTEESNYWHLQPTSLLCVWTKLKGHRYEEISFISVFHFSLWVFHYP